MGVLDVLSGLANAAGQGYAGYAQDQQQQVKQALAEAAAKQQAARDAVLNRVALAGIDPAVQGTLASVRANAAVQPHIAEAVGSAAGVAPIHTQEAIDTAAGTAPIHTQETINTAKGVSPVTTQTAVNTERATAPIKTAQAIATAKGTADFAPPIATQDRPGDPTSPVTYKTRSEALGTGKAPGAATGGGSVSAQTQQARLLAAVSEARLADERMRAYEDKLLNGSAKISPLEQAGGSLTTNLSDSHSVLGALTQAGSEFSLNHTDPEYSQYLRDAATIGRAEQMMSPRGGNETMVRANALLSRAGTGAMANTIDASRMARQALFGHAGGVSQALTPAQNAQLDAGVQKIKGGDITLGAPAATGKTTVINGKTYVLPP